MKHLKDLGLNQDQEQQALAEAARETQLGDQPVDLSELSEGESATLRQSRVRAGVQDVDGPTSLDEIKDVLGLPTYNRIGARQKPRTWQKALSEEEKSLAAEDAAIKEKVIDNKDAAKVLVGVWRGLKQRRNSLTRLKLQKALSLTVQQAQALINNMKTEGVVEPVSRTKVRPANPPTPPTEQQEAERSAETVHNELTRMRQEQQERINAAKEVGVGSQAEQLAIEDAQRAIDELDAKIKVQEVKLSDVRASAPPRPSASQARNNQALVVQEEAEGAKPTEEYKRRINAVANALRKYLFGLGLKDVDLVSQNVIDYFRDY